MPELSKQSRHILLLAIVGLTGAIALPWHVVPSGFWEFTWLAQLGEADAAPLFLQALLHGRWQLLPIGLCLLVVLIELFRRRGPRGTVVAAAGGVGLFWMFAQGLLIGLRGWNANLLEQVFGPIAAAPCFSSSLRDWL
jgi:iron(III) transport system permease protein